MRIFYPVLALNLLFATLATASHISDDEGEKKSSISYMSLPYKPHAGVEEITQEPSEIKPETTQETTQKKVYYSKFTMTCMVPDNEGLFPQ